MSDRKRGVVSETVKKVLEKYNVRGIDFSTISPDAIKIIH